MNGWNRAVMTLLAAGVAGFLLWLAAQFDMRTTGGYWAALGIVAGCGLLLGLAQPGGPGATRRPCSRSAFCPCSSARAGSSCTPSPTRTGSEAT